VEFIRNYAKLGLKVYSYNQQWIEELNKIPPPWNEMMTDFAVNLVAWIGEEESKKKSRRVKASLRSKGGVTVSHLGNKWGRKSVPASAEKEVLQLAATGLSIRKIAGKVYYWDSNNNKRNVSRGVVHKILQGNRTVEFS